MHEYVEAVEVELVGEPAYVVEVGDVAAVEGELRAGHRRLELTLDPGTLHLIAYDEPHVGAEPGQSLSGREAQTRGRTGHRGQSGR